MATDDQVVLMGTRPMATGDRVRRTVATREHGLVRIERSGDKIRIGAGGCELRLRREEAWRLAEAIDAVATEA